MIDENNEQAGIMALEKALERARGLELDLVEVAPNANPPVCKIMDFGKFLYRQKKQDQKQKKAQKQGEVKGIRLGLRTDTHDMEVKVAKAKEFLKERNIVKVAMILRGRELGRTDMAREKMEKFKGMLADTGTVEEMPKKQGNNIIMMITPK